MVKRIVQEELPEFNTLPFTRAEELYNAAVEYCDQLAVNESKTEYFKIEDKLWDRVVELPWAQKTEIINLVLKDVEKRRKS